MRKAFSGIIILCGLLATGCSKKDGAHQPDKVTRLPVAKGVSTGTVVTKTIGAEGGVVTTPDHTIAITIPAGALNTATAIGIEPITNTNIAGMATAFRLTPHGQQFSKPVSITFSYEAMQDSVSTPGALGIAFQGEDGVWNFTGGNTIDTIQKTVTATSTHFSDWSLMKWLVLRPFSATLSEDDELTLEALVHIATCNCDDDLVVPINGPGYPVGWPKPIDRKFIKKWDLAGPGTLIPVTGHDAVYKAPKTIISPFTVAVSVELVSKHQLMLVSNIDLISKDVFEMRINGGAWKRYETRAITMNGELGISYVNGAESISLHLPAGKGSFAWDWKISGDKTATFSHYPNGNALQYTDRYYKDQNDLWQPSPGAVVITEFGKVGEYISGTFKLAPAGIRISLAQTQQNATVEGRFRLKRYSL